jgi:hypothetical protein
VPARVEGASEKIGGCRPNSECAVPNQGGWDRTRVGAEARAAAAAALWNEHGWGARTTPKALSRNDDDDDDDSGDGTKTQARRRRRRRRGAARGQLSVKATVESNPIQSEDEFRSQRALISHKVKAPPPGVCVRGDSATTPPPRTDPRPPAATTADPPAREKAQVGGDFAAAADDERTNERTSERATLPLLPRAGCSCSCVPRISHPYGCSYCRRSSIGDGNAPSRALESPFLALLGPVRPLIAAKDEKEEEEEEEQPIQAADEETATRRRRPHAERLAPIINAIRSVLCATFGTTEA